MKTPSFHILLPISLAVSCHAATVIHSWDFEGDYLDDAGAAEGSLTGSTTVTNTTGFNGGTAAKFQRFASTNGDATVNLAHTSVSPTITTPISGFSITFWMRIADDGFTGNANNATTGNRGIFDFNAAGTDSGYHGLYTTGNTAEQGKGQLNFRVDNGANTNNVIFLSQLLALEDNQWHHVAVTFNPGQASGGVLGYLDGVGLSNLNVANGNTTGFATGDIDAQFNPYLGAFNLAGTAANGALNGDLDEFEIWSGVLSPAEVIDLAAVPETSSTILGLIGTLGLLRRRR